MKLFGKAQRVDVFAAVILSTMVLAIAIDRNSFTGQLPESLDQYLQGSARFRSVYLVSRDGKTYYVFTEGPKLYFLASGPTAFVFDPEGDLVDHEYDIGDSRIFADKWGSVSDWEEVPRSRIQEALETRGYQLYVPESGNPQNVVGSVGSKRERPD